MLSSTALLADEIMDDFYKLTKAKEVIAKNGNKASSNKQQVKTIRLAKLTPLRSNTSEGNLSQTTSRSKVVEGFSANEKNTAHKEYPVNEAEQYHTPIRSSESSKSLTSNKTDNIHYLSNLQHRAAGMSGLSPSSSKLSPSPKKVKLEVGNPDTVLSVIDECDKTNDSSNMLMIGNDENTQKQHAQLHRNLNDNIEQMQFRILQDSSNISTIMGKIIDQYEGMKILLESSFFHRKELYEKVNDINENYLSLFETLMEEVMKLQRNKFKSQTHVIEDLQHEHNVLYADYSIQTQSLQALKAKYKQQEEEMKLFELQALDQLQQIETEKKKFCELQHAKHQDEIEIKRLTILLSEYNNVEPGARKNKFLYEQEIKQLEERNAKLAENYQKLQQEYLASVSEMKERNELLLKEIAELKVQMKNMSVFQNLEKITDFQYPKETQATQTEVNPWDGLWDVSNGWILPIRKTTAARIRWRQSMNFAKCKFCRGIGKNLLMVIKLLTQIEKTGHVATSADAAVVERISGSGKNKKALASMSLSAHNNKIEMVGAVDEEAVKVNKRQVQEWRDEDKEVFFHEQDNFFYYWKLTNELVLFIQSLPHSIVALNPKNHLLWVLKRSYVILQYKYLFDMQDGESVGSTHSNSEEHGSKSGATRYSMQFYPQPLTTFVIEQFLRNADNRHEAEHMFFEYLLNLKEYYLQHPLLFYIARCFGLIDGLTSAQQKELQDELMKNRQALMKKKEKELQTMKAREKAKYQAKVKEEHEKLLFQPDFGIYYEDEFQITPYALNEQILFFSLFFKQCCLKEPYNGVYTRQIRNIRENSAKLRHFVQDFQKATDKFWFKTYASLQKTAHLGSKSGVASQANLENMVLIPNHLFIDMNAHYQFYLPLDRAIHVIHAIVRVEELPFAHQVSIYRKLEENVRFLSDKDGSLYVAEGMHSFIRSTMRLLLYSSRTGSVRGEDIDSWEEVVANYSHPLNVPVNGVSNENDMDALSIGAEDTSPATSSAKAQFHQEIHEHVLMVNFDVVMMVIGEVLRHKSLSIERNIMKIFDQGDTNHDNVLSYEEFQDIIDRVIPNYPYRKVLQMFREGLIEGEDGNNECIGPNSFLIICKKYQLFTLMDLSAYRDDCLSALCLSREPSTEIASLEKDCSFLTLPVANSLVEENSSNKSNKSNNNNQFSNRSSKSTTSITAVPLITSYFNPNADNKQLRRQEQNNRKNAKKAKASDSTPSQQLTIAESVIFDDEDTSVIAASSAVIVATTASVPIAAPMVVSIAAPVLDSLPSRMMTSKKKSDPATSTNKNNNALSVPSSHHLPVLVPLATDTSALLPQLSSKTANTVTAAATATAATINNVPAPISTIMSTPIPLPLQLLLPINESRSKEYHMQVLSALQQKKQARLNV